MSRKKRCRIAAVHAAAWGLFTFYLTTRDANIELAFFNRKDDTVTVPLLYGMLLNAAVFYGNAFWLMPRFFHSRKRYLLLAVAGILLISALETALDVWYGMNQPAVVEKIRAVFESEVRIPWQPKVAATLLALQMFFINLFVHPVYWGLSLAYRLYHDWWIGERKREALFREKMRAELNYLRAQINPHFLFNGINSIYHLIDRDPDMAKDVLLKFSGLLRYQLYECSSDSIALGKELDYLENYIALEKIRKGGDAVVEYAISAGTVPLKIAPLLLTPLVENAFKYLSNHSGAERNRLTIDLCVEKSLLELSVSNTCEPELRDASKPGGLGLQNVRQRLALLYPDRHCLRIDDGDSRYSVYLQIELNHA